MITNVSDKIPEIYKDYYRENENKFDEVVEITLPAQHLLLLNEEAKKNGTSLNLLVNYVLLKAVCEMKAKEEGFELGLPYFDFELFDEDDLTGMINQYQKILILDEHADKKAVLLAPELYLKINQSAKIHEKTEYIPD